MKATLASPYGRASNAHRRSSELLVLGPCSRRRTARAPVADEPAPGRNTERIGTLLEVARRSSTLRSRSPRIRQPRRLGEHLPRSHVRVRDPVGVCVQLRPDTSGQLDLARVAQRIGDGPEHTGPTKVGGRPVPRLASPPGVGSCAPVSGDLPRGSDWCASHPIGMPVTVKANVAYTSASGRPAVAPVPAPPDAVPSSLSGPCATQ